jgi:hypothetical protein
MEDKRSIKKVLESQGDMHEKVANQSNLELPSSSPTQSPGPPHIQIDVQIAYDLCFGSYSYAQKAKKIAFLEPFLVLRQYFGPMGYVSNWSPLGTHPRVRPLP